MDQLSVAGLSTGSYTMTTTYVTLGSFLLYDCILTSRGYALIANIFLEAINAKFGATIRLV